jgi:transglutaminase superfamily protein
VKSFWRRANPRQRLRVIPAHALEDAWLLLQIVVFASGVPVLMRLPLNRVKRILRPAPRSATASPQHLLALLDLVFSAMRHLRPTCLTRGVTRCYFLRRAGFDVELAFGMSPTTAVGGHCWLVRDGLPFLESRDPRAMFAEMFRV